jgi:hypothetical protein
MARITNNLFESIQKVTAGEVVEGSVDKSHYCATHVEHALLGYGECISEQHAEPDENGNIAWYTVQFPTGAHKITTDQLRIVEGKSHMHSKKMAEDTEAIEEAEGGIPKTEKHKKLASHYGDPNRITRGDVITAAKKNAMKEGIDPETKKDIRARSDRAMADLDNEVEKSREREKEENSVNTPEPVIKPTVKAKKPGAGEIGEAKDMSAFDWKSKVKKPESSFSAKKISTGTVYTKKYKEEKDDDDLKSSSRRATISSAVLGKGEVKKQKSMKEGVVQTIINHNDFVLEVTDNPTFKDYFAAMQTIVPSMDENIQKEMVAIATEAYNEGYVDVILESMARQAFLDTLNNYRKEGYSVLDENYTSDVSTACVEYTVEKDGNITKYVHTGAVIKESK